MKQNNIHIIGVSEEQQEKKSESLFEEIRAENFPNLKKVRHIQFQKAQRIPNKMKPEVHSKNITIKMSKVKDKQSLLEAAREK